MRRFDAFYKIIRGDNLGDPEVWNKRLEDLDLRMHARELDGQRIDSAVDALVAVALQRLNDTFTPLILDAEARLSNFGALFTGLSASTVTIGTGEKTFVLTAETREGYVFTDYVNARVVTDVTKSMTGQVVSYDRVTGILVVNVELVDGAGTFSNWEITVAGKPDTTHATRIDNPHQTTAAQVGAYTTVQVDALLDALDNALTVAFAAGLATKADLTHTHNLADITGGQFQTLVDQASIAWNAASGRTAKVTIGATRTMASPTNLIAGVEYKLIVVQGGAGNFGINWNAVFKWPGGVPPVLSTAPGSIDVFPFLYDGANLLGTWLNYPA